MKSKIALKHIESYPQASNVAYFIAKLLAFYLKSVDCGQFLENVNNSV